jgi:alpha-acetolactate decarboxylase
MKKEMVYGTLESINGNTVTIEGKNYRVTDEQIIDALSESVAEQVRVVVEYRDDDVSLTSNQHETY